MVIPTTCQKCGVTIRLDFGNLTKEEAEQIANRMDNTPRECPGMHTELGGWKRLWNLDDAIRRAYDLGQGETPTPVISDKEHLEALLKEGKDIVDGGLNTVPELCLPNIHDFKDLEHAGFGNFASSTHLFLRCDSPRGTRFYSREPR